MTMNPLNLDSHQQQELSLTDVQAKQIAGLLDTHADRLSMRTLQQLENSRELAVKTHAQQLAGVAVNQDGTISHLFSWADHHRVASTGLLLGAIIAGFVLMQTLGQKNEHGDAFLLGADLPPEAFVDRGFEPLLNNTHAKL
ncbi:MAG: DUF3619 family protein [Pseudomonadota bacterium]